MEEKLKMIIDNLKSITTKDMLGNYSQWNCPKKVLAEDIEELEKALEERDNLKRKLANTIKRHQKQRSKLKKQIKDLKEK